MNSGIYKIFNIITKECYIGSTSNIKTRFRNHKSKLRYNKHSNNHLQNSWNKHKEESFEFIVLETCDRSILKTREQYYIDTVLPEYNKSKKADSYPDIKFNKESLIKLSNSKKNVLLSEVSKNIMKERWKSTRDKHPLCKLNSAIVNSLITEFNNGEDISVLASRYLVQRKTILGVLAGRSWKEFNFLVDQSKWNLIKRIRS